LNFVAETLKENDYFGCMKKDSSVLECGGKVSMELSLPGINDVMDADIDWSDAGFYGFLESLSNAPEGQVDI
jgi:hypothetical protein